MRRNGFTLVELMVAMACAGIVALVAFGAWSGMQRFYVQKQKDYQAQSGQLLQDLIQTKKRVVVNPDPNTIIKRY